MASSLNDLEKKARDTALRQVVELFQKPMDLDQIDLMKTQYKNQILATESQLNMVMQSQMDDIKAALHRMHTTIEEAKLSGQRIGETASELGCLKSLLPALNELKVVSDKESQLAAAMKNMLYLVKVPEATEQAREYFESNCILEGHKILQELEGIRDQLMLEVYQDSSDDLDILRDFFKGINDLNTLIKPYIRNIGSRMFSAVVTKTNLVVDYVRIIDREERADAIWQKRSEKNGFLPDGRPKRWKELLFDGIRQAVEERVFGSAVDGDDDKSKLARHNEIIRQYAMNDLKKIKNFGPTCFPADYDVFNQIVGIYHDTIASYVETLVSGDLTDKQIIQLFGWINSYHTDEFMNAPALYIDFDRITLRYPINLLADDKMNSLREQCIAKLTDFLRTCLMNALTKDKEDWQQPISPQLDGSCFYFTNLPVLVMSPVLEWIGKGNLLQFLGPTCRERCLPEYVKVMAQFVVSYESQLKQYHLEYLQDRRRFYYYFEYMLANANNAIVIAESFAEAMMQELAEDACLKGRLSVQVNQLKIAYGKIAATCCKWVQVPIFLDLDTVLVSIKTRSWLSSNYISDLLLGTLEDYDGSMCHLRPVAYKPLAEELAESVILRYLKAVHTKQGDIKTDDDRRQAGERITTDGQSLRQFFEQQMKVNPELLKAFDVFPAIAGIFLTSDVSMISLDIVNLQRQFPDIRPDQVYSLLMARNDLTANKARELSTDYQSGTESAGKRSPFNLFAKLTVSQK